MKQKTVRFLSFLSALCMVTAQSVPALAADSTQETNIAGKQSAIVNYEQASAFSVTIPKAIVLNSDKNAAYNVKVKGDIAGNESVTVIPDATVTLNDANGKTPVTGTIDQVKTEFLCNEIAADDGCSTDGKITADSLTSGDWSGVFKFEIGTNAGIGDEISLTSNDLTTYNIDTVGDVAIPRFVTDNDNKKHAVTSISDYAFRNCNEMTSVAIADSVTRVGTGAFANCSKLSSVTIPNSVKSIGNSVFDGCASLSVINYNGNEYDSSNIESALEANGIIIGDNIFDHSYGQPVYEWSDNNATCTATKTCSECDNTITETVEVSQQTTDATCTNEGLNTYTATFKNSDFETQTKTSKISAKGHKSVSANNAVAATCTTDGKESDMVCSVCGVTLATGKTIAKTGHKFGTPTYTWTNDKKSCVAKRVCANDGTIETEAGTITNKVKTPATCTAKGTRTYTATFKNQAFKTQTADIQDIVALGHSYSNPVYTWSAYNSRCTATKTCSRCNGVGTENGTITNKVKTPATCTRKGTTTYTATFKDAVFKTQTKDVQDLVALGHTPVNGHCTRCNETIEGLYDANGVLLCSWKNSGIDVTSNYSSSTYKTAPPSPYYVLTNRYPTTTKVVMPNTVTSIGNNAFKDCKKLTSITISARVTSIGQDAFFGCENLTSVTIPKSVTSIGEYAFYNTKLTSITIPNSVTSIGNCAFAGCENLTNIIVDSANTVYDSRNNCNAIIKTATNTLISGCKNTIIPNTVTSIGERAFLNCKKITSVTIPESVTSIGMMAFYNCTNLTSITIPKSVTGIGNKAFYGCSSLTNIMIPENVTSIGYNAFSQVPHITYHGTATGSPWGAKAIN